MSEFERFVDSLRTEVTRALPREQADAVAAEARDHLEASIESRLELGMSYADAEREAIEAFGPIPYFAPPDERGRRLAFLLGTVALKGAILIALVPALGSGLGVAIVPTDLVLLYAAAMFVRSCYRVRRPSTVGLVCLAVLATSMAAAYIHGLGHGGFGATYRQMFVEGPRASLAGIPWASQAIGGAYEQRFLWMTLVGVLLGIDVIAGGFGAWRSGRRQA